MKTLIQIYDNVITLEAVDMISKIYTNGTYFFNITLRSSEIVTIYPFDKIEENNPEALKELETIRNTLIQKWDNIHDNSFILTPEKN